MSTIPHSYFKSDSRSYFKELLLATVLLCSGWPFVLQLLLSCHKRHRRSYAMRSRGWQVSKRCSHQVRAVIFLNEKQAAVILGENQIGRPRAEPEGSCLAWALCITEEKKNQKQGKGREHFMSIIYLWVLCCIACPIWTSIAIILAEAGALG